MRRLRLGGGVDVIGGLRGSQVEEGIRGLRRRGLNGGLVKWVCRLNRGLIHRSGVVFSRLGEGIRGSGMLIRGLVKRIG